MALMQKKVRRQRAFDEATALLYPNQNPVALVRQGSGAAYDDTALRALITALTGRVQALESAGGGTSDIISGLTASISALRDGTTASKNAAKADALSAYQANNSAPAQAYLRGLSADKTANNIFSGSYVSYVVPAVPNNVYYNPWVVIPVANLSYFRALVLTGDSAGEDDTANWEVSPGVNVGSGRGLYVRNQELASGETLGFEFKIWR